MASASLLNSSPVLQKSEFVKGGQPIRLSSTAAVRCQPTTATSGLTIRASYADELVKTAVSRGKSSETNTSLHIV